MSNESTGDGMVENGTVTVSANAVADVVSLPCEERLEEIAQPGDEQTTAKTDDGGDNLAEKKPTADAGTGRDGNRVRQIVKDSPAGIIGSFSGDNSTFQFGLISPFDAPKRSDLIISNEQLQSAKRSYKSLNSSNIAAYTGALLTHRILLVSCYNDKVALNVAKSIAFENKDASKQLVTIETNCQGHYTLRSLIEQLARPKENSSQGESRASQHSPASICVWAANDTRESDIGDISSTILDSLFTGNAHIEQYQTQLSNYGLCLICLVSPRKLQDYKRARFEVNLQNWDIDFLRPLLEEHGLDEYEELAETIIRQRQQGLWSADDAGFYNEIGRYLRDRTLPKIVADKSQSGHHDDLGVQQLFDRQDPLIDTVLYCATYYPDLSPQDFSYLVELSLGDATEEVARKIDPSQPQDGEEKVSPFESVPLTRRWRRETDTILRRCKLAALTNEDNRRVVDFQVDGLRNRLSQYIRSDHYFFYESRFFSMRRQGLLFSPKKKIAEGSRQLLVEMATQYAPKEVANWLYEIVVEFEHMAHAGVYLPGERPQLFRLLPDGQVRAARHLVCQGLGLVLSRINKEPGLQEAARLFWQTLLQTQRQWFLDLLRQVGNSAPAESLNWLKQLLDQSPKEIRDPAISYLVGYLLRRDSLIYPALKELMQWPKATQAGRTAQVLFLVYCLETNRQLAQQDYGRWPSLHPLFGFQSRAEAVEYIDLLISWLFTAAFAVHEDNALFAIADIIAGWYFILSPPSRPEASDAANMADDLAELDAQSVRGLLLERLAKHISRPRKNGLLEIWEGYKHDILEEVFQLDKFANQLAAISLNAQLMTDAGTARRKLIDTRDLLSQLRKSFIRCAAMVLQG